MKIALLSYAFAPGVGGIETVSRLLQTGLAARGHEVTVITNTPGDSEAGVLRQPKTGELLSALRRSDAVLQSNVSVGLAWPLVTGLVRRPWVVVNHTPIARTSGERNWRDHLKVASLRGARVYSVSDYLRQVTLPDSGVMPNPYDAAVFHDTGSGQRAGDLLFVGRLVPAKGLDVLVDALARLKALGRPRHLSIAGGGPAQAAVEAQVERLGLTDSVTWLGVLRGSALAEAMRAHKVVVVPSRPQPPEALPLVPLEAVACGCVVIATRQGGLPESVGDCGLLVEPEDPAELATAIDRLLGDPELQRELLSHREHHLAPFEPQAVIGKYETALREAAR